MDIRELGLDPLTYIGKITRDDAGKIRYLELVYDGESIKVKDLDEFLTFTTTVALETWV